MPLAKGPAKVGLGPGGECPVSEVGARTSAAAQRRAVTPVTTGHRREVPPVLDADAGRRHRDAGTMVDPLSRQQAEAEHMQHPADRADARGWEAPVDRRNGAQVRDHLRHVTVAQLLEGVARHEDERSAAPSYPVPNRPEEVLVVISRANSAGAAGQVSGGEPPEERPVEDDLAAQICAVARSARCHRRD